MNKMFESAVLKLTMWYVGVLMLVSLAFSLPVFIITSDRLEQSAARQMQILQDNRSVWPTMMRIGDLDARRQAQLELDRQQLLSNIVFENLLILVLGAVASYLFARWTLRPIEEAHAAQSTFTANASHQLRTPLATMQAEIDVALRDKKLSASQAREVLNSNLEEIGRLRMLSDQLLGLTRGEESVMNGVFDVPKLVKDFVAKNSKRYALNLKSERNDKLAVRGDEVLIGEVLKILCENAKQYGGGKPITLSYSAGRGMVRIAVSDQGPGLSTEEQKHVFDRFYRGKGATKSHPSGHGLGLALARDIVARHGGNLALKSKPGQGSIFTIYLPRSSR